MDQPEEVGLQRRVRQRRSVAEKRRIVELTLVAGASLALVARAHGVNANQVFKWRREYERGELTAPRSPSALLPVVLSGADRAQATSASIHIEFPGRALISIESGADPILLRSILESLRK
jgi:transposase